MSEQITPAWLRRQNDLLAVAKAAQQEQELASMTIKANGPEYWKALLKELQIIAAAVGPGLIGSFSHSNFSLSRVEDHCRLQVARCGPVHKLSYADLWYRTGDSAIRCKKAFSARPSSCNFASWMGRFAPRQKSISNQ